MATDIKVSTTVTVQAGEETLTLDREAAVALQRALAAALGPLPPTLPYPVLAPNERNSILDVIKARERPHQAPWLQPWSPKLGEVWCGPVRDALARGGVAA